MDEDQATILRIYQYLLAKDVQVKQEIADHQKSLFLIKPDITDVTEYVYHLIKLEVWQEISSELWHLIK